MIDYVKIQLSISPVPLINTLIDAEWEIGGRWDRVTGVVEEYPLTAWNDTLEIKFKSAGFIELSGSLHKFAHDGANHSDFTFKDLLQTIFALCQTLRINPHSCVLRNVEFGVNVQPPFGTKSFLNHVVCYGSTMFTGMPSKAGISLGIECRLSHFRIKMYCKKSQYDLAQETMRFEIHVEKMHYLHEKHIPLKTLADLTDPAMLHKLGDLLFKVFNEIVIIDKSVDQPMLTATEKRIYETWLNPIDIQMLRDESTNKFQYQRRCLKEIQKKYSTEKKQQVTALLIKEKLNTLLQTDQQALTILTDFQNRYPAVYFNESYQLPKVPKKADFNESYHSNKRTDSLKPPPPENNDLLNSGEPKNISVIKVEKKELQVGKNDEKNKVVQIIPAPVVTAKPKPPPTHWTAAINELQTFFNSITVSENPVKLNAHTTITNVSKFIESHLATVTANNGNVTFLPYLERLIQLKQILT